MSTPDRYAELFAAPRVTTQTDADGNLILTSQIPLPTPARCIGDWLVHWAQETPEQVLFAERDGADWRRLSYGAALRDVEEVAGWLLSTDASPERPVLALSENSVDLGVLCLAAMHVGVPIAVVSTAYSLMSKDHAKLTAMVALLDPAVVFVSDTAPYGPALDAIAPAHSGLVLASRDTAGRGAVTLAEARRPEAAKEVAAAFAQVRGDTVAKLLFTSGSTGTPKAVINTHTMLTANQEANREIWTHLKDKPPVLVDWLPWSHTFGANFCMNMVLRNGGAMYIDDGKPAPPLIGRTIANFKDVRPTMALNVPRGFAMLADALEDDTELREVFFGLDLAMNAGAALPASIHNRFRKMSLESVGTELPFVSAWGSTETAPLATHRQFATPDASNIGLPVPGVTLKLTPNADKHEVWIKGPSVTPGYFRNPAQTAAAFDADGFYRIGDAARLADPSAPDAGLCFDGRVSEDFKLSSGTWVHVGDLRVRGIDALAPLVQDIAITGHDRDTVGFLLVPNEAACRECAGLAADAPLEAVLNADTVRHHIAQGLDALRAEGGGSSRFAARARFLTTPPDPDAGEITDKAYLNQRQILVNRTEDVAALCDSAAGDNILPN